MGRLRKAGVFLKKCYAFGAGVLDKLASIPSKIRYFDLIVVLLFAGYFLWLAFSHILFHGLWCDESYSVQLGLHPFTAIIRQVASGMDAPLYYLFLHFWEMLFGISEPAVRSLSVIFSTATLVILYGLAKRFLNRQTAFYSCLLYIGSTFELHYAMETRCYALVGLFAVMSFYVFFSLVQKPTLIKCIALGIVNALVVYTHYVAVFILVVEGIAGLLFLKKQEKHFIIFIVISMSISSLLMLPWLRNIIDNLPTPTNSWQKPPNSHGLAMLLEFFFFNNIRLFYAACWFSGISLVLIFVSLKRRLLSWPKLISLFVFAALPIAIDYFLSARIPIFVFRYMIYALLGIFLFLGYLFSLTPISSPIKITLALLFFSSLYGAAALGAYRNNDWQYAVPVVRSERQLHPYARILVSPAYQEATFAYHWDKKIYAQYNDFNELLKKDSVFTVENMRQLRFHLEPLPKEIIFVRADPMYELRKALDSAYTYKKDTDFCGVNVEIYRNGK